MVVRWYGLFPFRNVHILEYGRQYRKDQENWRHIVQDAAFSLLHLLGSLASIAALFFTGIPDSFRALVMPPSSILVLLFIIFFSLFLYRVWVRYVRWRLYVYAAVNLHQMTHNLRETLSKNKLALIQEEIRTLAWNRPDPENSAFLSLLCRILNDVRDLFCGLVMSGSISANIMVPVPPKGDDSEIRYLQMGVIAEPHDNLTRERYRRLIERAKEGKPASIALGEKERASSSIGGEAFLKKRTILVHDIACSVSPLTFDTDPNRTEGEDTHRYMRSLLSVPIVVNGQPFLVLNVSCSEPWQFYPDYMELMRMSADLLGLICKIAGFGPEPASE